MACIITYENKQYTQKEFEQYFREHFTEFVDNFLGSQADIENFKEFVQEEKDDLKPFIDESNKIGEQIKDVEDNIQFSLSPEINYQLKAIEILNSDKAKQIFDKGEKNKWDLNKILNELQIPKDQKQLILDLGIADREQIALELASNYSYSVEINTAKENHTDEGKDSEEHNNLNVPGGTNYKINVFKTPLIIPSIINHFFHKNQIGWFRSDDKSQPLQGELPYENILKSREGWEFEQKVAEYFNNEEPEATKEQKLQYLRETLNKDLFIESSKTRRILEVQSDLFQKGRDLDDLVTKQTKSSLDSFSTQMSNLNRALDNSEITLEEYRTQRSILESKNYLIINGLIKLFNLLLIDFLKCFLTLEV
jgi:hypothetical protein